MECDTNELERKDVTGLLQRGSSERIRKILRRHSGVRDRNNSAEQEIDEGLNPKLKKILEAYLVGVMYGDGTANKKSVRNKNGKFYEQYRIKLGTVDKEFIELYVQVLNALGLSSHQSVEKRRQENWKDMFNAVSQDLHTYKYVSKIKTATRVKHMSKPELVIFLKGIFDSDGSIAGRGLGINISKNPQHIASPLIKYALNRLGIKYSYYIQGMREGRTIHEGTFGIFGNDAKKLHELFGGFTIQRKEERYMDLLTSQKQIQWSDEHLVLLAELRKKGLDYKEIAKKLGRSNGSVAHKLSRLIDKKTKT